MDRSMGWLFTLIGLVRWGGCLHGMVKAHGFCSIGRIGPRGGLGPPAVGVLFNRRRR